MIHKLPSLKPYKHPTCKWRVNYTALNGGGVKRLSKAFKTKRDAKTFYDLKLNEFKVYNVISLNELIALMPCLTKSIKFAEEYSEKVELEHLNDVVFREIKSIKQQLASQKIELVVESFLEEKIAKYQRKTKQTTSIGSHCRGLRSRLKKFTEFFGGEYLMSDVTLKNAKGFITCLYEDFEMEERTVLNHRSTVISFFNYGIKHDYVSGNVFLKTDLPEIVDKEIQFYSLEQMEQMWWLADADIKAAIVLQAFCGVRASEYKRMLWGDIHPQNDIIFIRGEVAKSGKKRSVVLEPVVSKQLAFLKNKICREDVEMNLFDQVEVNKAEESMTDFMDSLSKKELVPDSVVESPKVFNFSEPVYKEKLDAIIDLRILNGFRHSFGTYHYALHQDWMKTTERMGNSQKVLKHHYNGLTSQKEAENYFNIIDDLDLEPVEIDAEYTNDQADLSYDEILDLIKERNMAPHPSNRRLHKP